MSLKIALAKMKDIPLIIASIITSKEENPIRLFSSVELALLNHKNGLSPKLLSPVDLQNIFPHLCPSRRQHPFPRLGVIVKIWVAGIWHWSWANGCRPYNDCCRYRCRHRPKGHWYWALPRYYDRCRSDRTNNHRSMMREDRRVFIASGLRRIRRNQKIWRPWAQPCRIYILGLLDMKVFDQIW